jgi:hypothetical protein
VGGVNPLLDALARALASGDDVETARAAAIARYGFAVPSDEALDTIERWSPAGVVEVGAGTGYWAHCLAHRGVDVAAFDPEPPPSRDSRWFAGTEPWHPVERGDHTVVARYPERTLLVVWPAKNDIWAASALELLHDAGGACVIYVGERAGGRTGDDVFHALLGELTVCVQCAYGVTTAPCVCGVEARWRRQETVELPHWPGYADDLHVYTPA